LTKVHKRDHGDSCDSVGIKFRFGVNVHRHSIHLEGNDIIGPGLSGLRVYED